MQKSIAALVAILLLATNSGCAGVQGTSALGQSPTTHSSSFNAFVTQPVTPVVVTPGQPFIIIVQLVPINGFILGGPLFFNSFVGVNPFLTFTCPSLLAFGTPALGAIGFGGVPTIAIPISPIGFGTCTIPINVGLGGIFPLQVQISGLAGSASAQRKYVVRIVTQPAHH